MEEYFWDDVHQSLSKSAVRGLAEELCPDITDEEFEVSVVRMSEEGRSFQPGRKRLLNFDGMCR